MKKIGLLRLFWLITLAALCSFWTTALAQDISPLERLRQERRAKDESASAKQPRQNSPELSTTIVISQVYPGGGSGAAGVTYMKDYVEIKNISASPQPIAGLSLQYGSSTGNFGSVGTNIYSFTGSTILAPGQYYLVELAAPGAAGGVIVPTPNESTTNLSMAAASGKVALTNTATALACGATATPCTLPHANIIDLVSWGASNNGEGGTTVNNGVALPANTNGAVRKTGGCTETDNNNADFDVVVNPVPRNAASTAAPCGGGPAPSPARLFTTNLTGAAEVPPVVTNATGYGRVFLNDAETQITASVYYNNLTSGTVAGHIHGPAVPGVDGPIIFDMTPGSGQTSGSAEDRVFAVTPAQVAELKAGLWYFNIHTSNFTGGEIRGQLLPAKAPLDMDGDGRTDYVVVRDSNGGTAGGLIQWYINMNATGTQHLIAWGLIEQDILAFGDYDGDRKTDLGVFRQDPLATFYIIRSSTNTIYTDQLGLSTDQPVVGDYDGNGTDDTAVMRNNGNGTTSWYYRPNGASMFVTIQHGIDGSRAQADYDGDGRIDVTTFRQQGPGGRFWITHSGGGTTTIDIGLSSDLVASGDYNGDGKADVCVITEEGSLFKWTFRPSFGGADVQDTWGLIASDLPVPGDYNGDGKFDYAVWREAALSEFMIMTPVTRQVFGRQWGLALDTPAAIANVSNKN